ncbi:hypothetical protein [Enterococcus cecorum]|uniref:hypothetical protein n=1 Tax=Enterococcus cecorum TaxID=44008 RepID=UPI001FAD4FEB|nr:hypothetical protein [Enterococcus cecorum]MCJ0537830.1 hypothetical protein [Enterococcus cecorum]MCJ0546853.1 hypothetical protein [Enterococcus cecorum]MCJ0551894.1 hypothetical protein [Enterococcus cecorum]MCJ0570109.1 hypothetical protein [Enterococcus cecorum]
MINWKELFRSRERFDAKKDEWAEYTESSLQEFMTSDFMQDFANDCSNALKDEGNEFYNDYSMIKRKMDLVLDEFGYPSLHVMEDSYSEQKQLKMLQEFKSKYLNSK